LPWHIVDSKHLCVVPNLGLFHFVLSYPWGIFLFPRWLYFCQYGTRCLPSMLFSLFLNKQLAHGMPEPLYSKFKQVATKVKIRNVKSHPKKQNRIPYSFQLSVKSLCLWACFDLLSPLSVIDSPKVWKFYWISVWNIET
jgi:hypothetical protein